MLRKIKLLKYVHQQHNNMGEKQIKTKKSVFDPNMDASTFDMTLQLPVSRTWVSGRGLLSSLRPPSPGQWKIECFFFYFFVKNCRFCVVFRQIKIICFSPSPTRKILHYPGKKSADAHVHEFNIWEENKLGHFRPVQNYNMPPLKRL